MDPNDAVTDSSSDAKDDGFLNRRVRIFSFKGAKRK